jgi:dUTP pyrophosphatase
LRVPLIPEAIYKETSVKTILSKQDIQNLIDHKPPLIEDYVNLTEQLQPNGFDLTLREIAMLQTGGRIGVSNTQRMVSNLVPLVFDRQDFLDLVSGAYVITFNEVVHLPKNVMALGAPRSSLLRCGVTVHMAVWDAGYSGRSQSLMVVYNSQTFRVQRNARIAQLVFFELTGETEGYSGTYQGENIGK